jgi:hypothetical protein
MFFHASPQSGFSFLFVLFAIVLVGLSMMGANKQWVTMMKREREAELLYRGHQYRRAIASYVESVPGARQYPCASKISQRPANVEAPSAYGVHRPDHRGRFLRCRVGIGSRA